jgi:hypothetical protein
MVMTAEGQVAAIVVPSVSWLLEELTEERDVDCLE